MRGEVRKQAVRVEVCVCVQVGVVQEYVRGEAREQAVYVEVCVCVQVYVEV